METILGFLTENIIPAIFLAFAICFFLFGASVKRKKSPQESLERKLSNDEIVKRIISSGGGVWFSEYRRRFPSQKFDFSRSNFSRIWLHYVDFSGCNLKRAVFAYSHAWNCSFDEADLEEADFGHASLDDSSFRKAVLRRVNFVSADIQKTDFAFADAKGANFRNVTGHKPNFFNIVSDESTKGLEDAKKLAE